MKLFKILAVAFLTVVCGTSLAATELKNTCGEYTEPAPWSYCVSETVGSPNRDVMYYFHGALGNVNTWINSGHAKSMRQRWESQGKEAPVVINISFGSRWLLTSPNSSLYSGLFEAVTQGIMPKLESELVSGFTGRRTLMGFSMGGANVAQLVLKRPDMFSRASIACPAIITLSPHASQSEVAEYVRTTGADPELVEDMLETGRLIFPSSIEWNDFSPIVQGQSRFDGNSPAMHISCGKTDEYGFYNDTKKLAMIAREKGVDVVWQSLEGGHCAYEADVIADFMLD